MGQSPRVRSGFTLIELMCVIAIIGLLVASATPSLLKAVQRAKSAEVVGTTKEFGQLMENWSAEHNGHFKDLLPRAGVSWNSPFITYAMNWSDLLPAKHRPALVDRYGVMRYRIRGWIGGDRAPVSPGSIGNFDLIIPPGEGGSPFFGWEMGEAGWRPAAVGDEVTPRSGMDGEGYNSCMCLAVNSTATSYIVYGFANRGRKQFGMNVGVLAATARN